MTDDALTYRSPTGSFMAELWSKNLFDCSGPTVVPPPPRAVVLGAIYLRPRIFGVTLGYDF
jgi:hypothetical protein